MYSGRFLAVTNFDKFRKLVVVLAVTAVTTAMLFCVSVPSVSAEGSVTAPTAVSVNLREGDWVYSVYSSKDKELYAAVTRYDGDEIDVEIPAVLDKYAVREISREAFCGKIYITSVIIPDSVKKIGKYAFSGCIGLNRVIFPLSLQVIGDGAFYGCLSLREAELPDSTSIIGSFAFYNCRHLEKTVFPKALRSIGDNAFDGCRMLSELQLAGELDSVGEMAFHGCSSVISADLRSVAGLGSGAFINCTSLEKVILGNNLTEIQHDTFRGCKTLRSIEFGSSLTSIGTSAFEGCESLKSLPHLDSLKEIDSLAFRNCALLNKSDIGANVSSIGKGAFIGCTALAKVTVEEGNKTYSSDNGCLYIQGGKELAFCPEGFRGTMKLAETTETISPYAAAGCGYVSGLVMNDTLTAIGNGAFLNCHDITSLSVPDSVNSIGNASLGVYLTDHSAKREKYLNIYASENSIAKEYCAAHEMSFTPYDVTLFTGSDRLVIAEGQNFTVKYGFTSRKKSAVTWISSDEAVVTVREGKLSAVSQGSAVVTLSAEGFQPREIKVIVTSSDNKKTNTEKEFDEKLIYCGETVELSSIFSQIIDPIFSANQFWHSTDPKVASVSDDGKVVAHGRGVALITRYMPDGSKNIITVKVTDRPAEFSLLSPENELTIGQSQSIGTVLYPSLSTDTVTWKSENEGIATVDSSGRVTAVGQGSCTISAVTSSGLKSSTVVRCVIPAESISLDLETRDVYQGKEFNLTAALIPDNSKQKIFWRSSDPTVATVNSKGKVTGRSFGSAVIYAETADGLSAACSVNVITRAEELNLDVKTLRINRDSVYKLNAIIRPSYSPETTDRCAWSTTNDKVAVVDENGTVTAVGVGNCIINCRTGGDLISKCRVRVLLPAVSVKIKAEKDSIYIGEMLSLEALAEPEGYTDSVEWISDNDSIARVTPGGNVKGRSMGTAIISVRLTNDITGETVADSFQINVLRKAESVLLGKSSLSLLCGKTDFVTYSVEPDDCNDTVKWYSTDENVATVREDGLITAVAEGTCRIVIETGSGASAECAVTVK